MSKTFDLRTIQGYDTWIANASVGTHTIKISAKSTNPLYTESNKVIAGTISKYLIDPTLNNVTADASNPTTIISNEQKTLIYYADGTNFTLPNDVTVTNATKDSWTVITQYELTGTATNTTISSASTWVDATTGAATITVGADGTSYKLPTKINITGYANDIPAGTTTTISNKCTVLFTRTSDTSGSIAFSDVTDDVAFSVVGEAIVSYPVKGQLITMNLGNGTPAAGTNNQYRVLSINGSVAEVVAMYDMSSSQTFGADNTYSGSNLDTYLNSTFYGTLSSTAKTAIVDKTFTQDSWYWGTSGSPSYNGTYSSGSTRYDYQVSLSSNAYRPAITRHVYALSIQDVIDYLGVTTSMTHANTTLTPPNIWQMFWNTTAGPTTYTYPWLRSARADNSRLAWLVDGDIGFLNYSRGNSSDAARPALTIDLSKISWS